MNKFTLRILIFSLITVSLALSVFGNIFQTQEMSVYDFFFRTRPLKDTSSKIVIIEIADDTLKNLGRWPLPRQYHAGLIRALKDAGCRMIIFDILFSEQGPSDELLGQAMQEQGAVYLPYAFDIDPDKPSEAQEILGGVSESLRFAVAGTGHINIYVDKDGKVRRVPLMVHYMDKTWPSLGFLAAAKFLGKPVENLSGIPLEKDGSFWVNYPGSWTKAFRHFSYFDVLKAHAAKINKETSWLDLSIFKDKICFVGLTATGTSDLRANPIDPVYPMIGTQVSICDSILRHDFIRRVSINRRFIIILFLVFICFALCLKFQPLTSLILNALIILGYSVFSWALFSFKGVFIDLFLPVTAVVLVYIGVLAYKFFQEVQRRKIFEKELEIAASIQQSFLPPAVLERDAFKVNAYLKPAKMVGGDFYEMFSLGEDNVGVFIGDVSGKGISAALIMAQAISLLRTIAQKYPDPSVVLSELNQQLYRILKGRFVTGQYLVIHLKENYWEGACAGHLPLLFLHKKQARLEEILPASGAPLGLTENMNYQSQRYEFLPGEKLFLYTDGWTENRNNRGIEFGLDKLREHFLKACAYSPENIFGYLEKQKEEFENKSPQYDDVTAVLVEFKSKSADA